MFTKWDKRFIELAKTIATWSSCYNDNRQIGAVIVRNKRILTTGYNGAPSGIPSCVERKSCMRRELNIESGTRHELCYAIHAEQNAIVQAAYSGTSVKDGILYVTDQPCVLCAKMAINAGIKKIVFRGDYPDELAMELLKEAGVRVVKYDM